jgi:flagellar basal-body rod modification protein FlgD
MVSNASLTNTINAAQQSKTQQQSLKLTEDFNEFLTLLTTQLQNQDPLSPMDSNEFTNQLVQFSQVEQSINTNQKLDDLVSLQNTGVRSVGLGYVGMEVNYYSTELSYKGSGNTEINYVLPKEADKATVRIYDKKGVEVHYAEISKNTGLNRIVWDGKDKKGAQLAEGAYTIKIDALDRDEKKIDVNTIVNGVVNGIETQNGRVSLLVGNRPVAVDAVIKATKVPSSI